MYKYIKKGYTMLGGNNMKNILVLLLVLFLAGCSGQGNLETAPSKIDRGYTDTGSAIVFDAYTGTETIHIKEIHYGDNERVIVNVTDFSTFEIRVKERNVQFSTGLSGIHTVYMGYGTNSGLTVYMNNSEKQLDKADSLSFIRLYKIPENVKTEGYFLEDF